MGCMVSQWAQQEILDCRLRSRQVQVLYVLGIVGLRSIVLGGCVDGVRYVLTGLA